MILNLFEVIDPFEVLPRKMQIQIDSLCIIFQQVQEPLKTIHEQEVKNCFASLKIPLLSAFRNNLYVS